MSHNIEFIKAFKHWMIDLDYNQSDAAEHICCSKAFVSAVLTGKKNVPETWFSELPVKVTEPAIKDKIEYHLGEVAKLRGLLQ